MTRCVIAVYDGRVARWDPGAADRLRRAAIDLFAERGFENVSAAEVSERAGLTRRTFFRYFPDKREVLFAGSERLPVAVADAVRDAPADLPPLGAALHALRVTGSLVEEHVDPDQSRRRRAVIAASPELQERERTKLADCTSALGGVLVERGVAGDTAELVARVGVAIMGTAFARWIDRAGGADFASCFDEAVADVAAGFATVEVAGR